MSQKEQLRILGYSPDEIEKIMDELEEEKAIENEQAELALERSKVALDADKRHLSDGDSSADAGGTDDE